jgi:hypothetical protein
VTLRQITPDGRTIVLGWISFRGVWRVKFDDASRVYEGERLRDAIATATGQPADSDWIVELELDAARAEQRETVT